MKPLDVVLHTHKPLTADEIADLAGMGLRVVAALDAQVYRVRGTSDASLADLRALSYVAQATAYEPAEKLDSALKQQVRTVTMAAAAGGPEAEEVAAQTVNVLVSLDRHVDVSATLEALAEIGEVKESSSRRALVQVRADRLNEVAVLPGVLAVDTEPRLRAQNDIARGLTQIQPTASNRVNPIPVTAPNCESTAAETRASSTTVTIVVTWLCGLSERW